MKFVLAAITVLVAVGCTTLENRRDLYSPDVELYRRPIRTTVTRQSTTIVETKKTTTRKSRETAPEVRPLPAEPDETPPLPPP